MAVAQDITRGVLGVPGMNYSLLLTRSTDFASYSAFLYPKYTNELTRPLLLSLIQMLWDRSDPNGYAHHITSDPLPNTPAHKVLLHLAFGDHQVANVATEVEARTLGLYIHQPALAGGRHSDVNPYFGIPAIPSDPFDGSALIVWDSGAAHAADHQRRPIGQLRSALRPAELARGPQPEVGVPEEDGRHHRRRVPRRALRRAPLSAA